MPDLSQSRIGQIAIVCKDVARATDFYRDTLGLRFFRRRRPDALVLRLRRRPPHAHHRGTAGARPPSSILYFFVTDIEGTHSDLTAKGVTFLDTPHMIAQMPDHQLWLARSGLGRKHDGPDGRKALGISKDVIPSVARDLQLLNLGLNCVTQLQIPRRSAPRDDVVSAYPSSSTNWVSARWVSPHTV